MNSKSRRIEEQFAQMSDDDSDAKSSDGGDSRDECSEAATYVNQLIARMNGVEQNQSAGSLLQSGPVLQPIDDQPLKAESIFESDRPVAVSEESITIPQVRKPQRPVVMEEDLERLREAANISATGHLNSFETKQLYSSIYLYLILATGQFLLSIALIAMSHSILSTPYYVSVAVALGGLFCTSKYFRLTNRLGRLRKQQLGNLLRER
ncbi:MAG: hypothetical protein GY768_12545 [Planctomycetaceae bacterium]|nr:hypothetical protein [Planctomycetaceae bacterium]